MYSRALSLPCSALQERILRLCRAAWALMHETDIKYGMMPVSTTLIRHEERRKLCVSALLCLKKTAEKP